MSTFVSRPLLLTVALLIAGCDGCRKTPVAEPVIDSGTATAEQAPSDGVKLIRQADEALAAGKFDEAITLAQKAQELEPRHAVASNILGRAAAQRFGQTKDPNDAILAERAFNRALEQSPDFWPAHQNLGELYERQGMMDKAAAEYALVLASQKNHPDRRKYEEIIGRADSGR